MKHHLFRYLVEKQGFKVLAFEFGFVQGILLNEMLMSGKGDVDAFVRKRETIYYWPWSTEEVSALFQWIQDYNRGKADGDKIQVFGVDCQSMVFAQRVLPDMLKAYDPVFAEMIAQKLQVYPYPNYYGDVPDASLQEVRSKVLNDLRFVHEQVSSNAAAIATAISPEQYRLVEHMVRLLFQVEEVDYTGRINFVNGGVTRDRYMAENVNWIFEHLGEVKVAIWGHNGHVANDDFYLNFAPGSMGYHLKNAHGDAYQIIGLSFAKGTFNALQENNNNLSFRVFKFDDIPLEDSWNYYLHLADADNFMIKMSDLQSSDNWRSWLSRERRHLWIGAEFNNNWSIDDYYISKRMDRLYDVMIHFDNTTASTLLWE